MTVITISRDFGSEGNYIAEQTANKLGYHFVDKDFFAAVLSEYGLIEFDTEYDFRMGFWDMFDAKHNRREEVVHMLNQVIQAVAQHGNVVILGRSGFEVLEKYSGMFHVRLQSPLSLRIKRVMAEMNLSQEQAENLVVENDKVHTTFVQEYYKMPWDAAHVFDLVINTGKISPDLAITLLVDSVSSLSEIPDPNKPSINWTEMDNVLRRTVSTALKCEISHES